MPFLGPIGFRVFKTLLRIHGFVLETIKPFVADFSEFGTHSFRRGGASSAAASGVDERLLMSHGRWASSKSKDLYVVDPVATKMSVSSSLGI